MKFLLEVDLSNAANPKIELAEILAGLVNEVRKDGISSGEVREVCTRSYWRQSEDKESSEFVKDVLGKWEVVE